LKSATQRTPNRIAKARFIKSPLKIFHAFLVKPLINILRFFIACLVIFISNNAHENEINSLCCFKYILAMLYGAKQRL